ncbi:flagellar motor protein MotB [Helicobacter burdigaliensis]|uniref:flagellar motor protein MotB n=1 Tax=Helicobacter burdigaliensis TaxID=2315334 RepID=UPI000EF70168|nr:flagellar motor protein MotB [Helicobacter burdigaliensis]
MGKKAKHPECPAGEKWAVPYADFLSLLLALFIALWAISETNPAKVEALKVEFIKIFDFTASSLIERESEVQDKDSSPANFDVEALEREKVALDQKENNAILHLPTRVEFVRGSAEIISVETLVLIKRVGEIIKKMPKDLQIELRGYTDNSNEDPSKNFNLGSKRAQAIADLLIQQGINQEQLIIISFGDHNPLNGNKSDVENNRVEFHIRADDLDAKLKQTIMDKLSNF